VTRGKPIALAHYLIAIHLRCEYFNPLRHPPCTDSLSTSGHRVININKRCAVNQFMPRGQRVNAAWSTNGCRLVHEFSNSLLKIGSARSTLDPRVSNAQSTQGINHNASSELSPNGSPVDWGGLTTEMIRWRSGVHIVSAYAYAHIRTGAEWVPGGSNELWPLVTYDIHGRMREVLFFVLSRSPHETTDTHIMFVCQNKHTIYIPPRACRRRRRAWPASNLLWWWTFSAGSTSNPGTSPGGLFYFII
jgi:hypothetical protein